MVVKKGRSVTAEVKINLAVEGGSINWADEVEEADPPGWYPRHEAEQKKPERAARVKKEVKIKKEATYPYYVPLASYLAKELGEERMEKLRKELGVRTDEQMEKKYMAQIMREPGACKNPLGPKFRAFDVEKLGEGALQRLIRGWESGQEIVNVGEGGKTRPCVVMHALSPHSCHIINPVTTKEQASQDTGRDQIKGVEKKVNIC